MNVSRAVHEQLRSLAFRKRSTIKAVMEEAVLVVHGPPADVPLVSEEEQPEVASPSEVTQ